MYVDLAELAYNKAFDPAKTVVYKVDSQLFPTSEGHDLLYLEKLFDNWNSIIPAVSPDYKSGAQYVEYVLGPHGFFGKPPEWQSKRPSPGQIQQAVSQIIQARNQTASAFIDADWAKWVVDKSIQMFKYRVDKHKDIVGLQAWWHTGLIDRQTRTSTTRLSKYQLETWTDLAVADLMFVVGTANGTSASSKPLQLSMVALRSVGGGILDGLALSSSIIAKSLQLATDSALRGTELGIQSIEWDQEVRSEVIEIGNNLSSLQATVFPINSRLQELDDARRNYRSLVAEGDRIQAEREVFRQRAAAIIQGFRTRDAAFRVFRNEKLERYKSLFDLAARYALLAANAYDYETGLLHTKAGQEFVQRIISSRALGVVRDGEPQFAGSNTGDPGLSSALAEMKADWDVLKGRLGFNNPDAYGTTVSLRTENYRILPGTEGIQKWQDILHVARRDDVLADEDVRRYCLQIGADKGLPVPGIVLEFSTTITEGLNLFGRALAGGDHDFSQSSFATKIFAVGVALEGYRGMEDPSANSTAVDFAGGTSPSDPSVPFLDSKALSATPDVYLIPVGVDSMRSPPLGDASEVRTWAVQDVTIPLPFNIGGSGFSSKKLWQSSESLMEDLFSIRKHQSFRPVSSGRLFGEITSGGGGQLEPSQYTNRRLIGRSVWNSKWKLVIPGRELLNDPKEGLDRLIQTVTDVRLHFVTYSYAGH